MIGPYDTPQAFRTALETRLKNTARSRGVDLDRLRRGVAFDRLLARLFDGDDPPWLLKGGYALELRLRDRARSTLDLDVSVPDAVCLRLLEAAGEGVSCARVVYEQLQQAAEQDLGDGFEFLVGSLREQRTGAPRGGGRCPVDARLAGRTFARFQLDIGLGDAVLDTPDWIESDRLPAPVDLPGARIALYPLAQQFAEKAHAYTFPWQDRENTRVKDLVDMVLLVHLAHLEPERVGRALEATFETRDTHPLPARLPAPPPAWAASYADLARQLDLPASTLEEAHVYLDAYWQRWALGRAGE